MLSLTITIPKNDEEQSQVPATQLEEIYSRVLMVIKDLNRLGSVEAVNILDKVKKSEALPISFAFHIHSGDGTQADWFSGEGAPMGSSSHVVGGLGDAEMLGDSDNHTALTPAFSPPNDTIDPALLTISMMDRDNTVLDDSWQQDNSSIFSSNTPRLESQDSPLFVSPIDNTERESPCHETSRVEYQDPESSSTSLIGEGNLSPKTAQLSNHTDLTMGLPTPRSNTPSPPIPLTRKRNSSSCSRSNKSKVRKPDSARSTPKRLSSRRRDQTRDQLVGHGKSLKLTVPPFIRDTLCGIPQGDLRSLQLGDGLIQKSLCESLDQHSYLWQQNGFWFEDFINLPIREDSSAEERLCRVFRYVDTLTKRKPDQKLRLRMSQTLLYFEFDCLTRDKRNGLDQGTLRNPGQHRAATLSIDDLLKLADPSRWDSSDPETRKQCRSQFHEQKRAGSRWWQAAGALGLGVLIAGGDTLAKVIKYHNQYPIARLDTVLKYIANAHPGVVALYHEFDQLTKQILLGETLTMLPTRDTVRDRIHEAETTKLTLQEVEENWQQIDSVALSQELIKDLSKSHT